MTRDQVLFELVDFFMDELKRDPSATKDWLSQGDYDADEFISEVRKILGEKP